MTEVSWLRSEQPDQLRLFWEREYPEIRGIDANVRICQGAGYVVLGQFVLPESSWWDHYYSPLLTKLKVFQSKYKNDPERLEYLEAEKSEIDFYQKYSKFYGYVFYVMQVNETTTFKGEIARNEQEDFS